MITQLEVHQAEERYLKMKREFDAQSGPLDPFNVRSALDTLGKEGRINQERILRIEAMLCELNGTLAEKHGIAQPIPF